MPPIVRDGQWCDVCTLPSGAFAHVVGERGAVAAYSGTAAQPLWRRSVETDFLRFVRCAAAPTDGTVAAVGQGGDGRAWFVRSDEARPLAISYGVNPVALHHDGQRWVAFVVVRADRFLVVRADDGTVEAERDKPASFQGIRAVSADGTPVFVDDDADGTFAGFHLVDFHEQGGMVAGQHDHAVGVLVGRQPPHFFRARAGGFSYGVRLARSDDRLAVCALTDEGAWFGEFQPPFPPHESAAAPVPEPPPQQGSGEPSPLLAVTIDRFAPDHGPAPLTVAATGAVTRGNVTTLTWRWRRAGDTAWRTAPPVPSHQLQHHYQFDTAGDYEISLRGDGPGGFAETGLRRIVSVRAPEDAGPPPIAAPPAAPVAPLRPAVPSSGMRVATFRTASGHFLCADMGLTPPRLVADRTSAGAWETFRVEFVGRDLVQLRADNERYLTAEDGGGRQIVADRTTPPAEWERFRLVPLEDDAIALQAHGGQFVSAADGGGGAVSATAVAAGRNETFTSSVPLVDRRAAQVIAGRLRVDGRFFVNEAGTFRPVFSSALSILRRGDADVREFLDWAAQHGFNGLRVFAGALTWAGQSAASARDRLPFLLAEAAARGLYVEVTAITDSRDGGYDVRAHLAAVAAICDRVDNAILEVANEPYHPTQADFVHDPVQLLALGQQARVPFALGAAEEDESVEMGGGTYVTAHLDRGRDKWNQVRRVRELAMLSETTRKPVLNNEPIGAAESSSPGRRESDPAFFFCMGALNRVFEVGGVFHSDAGLEGRLPGPVQRSCADAFVAGSRIVPVADRLAFMNARWEASPVKDARFEDTIVRAYSGVSGSRAWTVLVGLSGDPGLVFQHGWRIRSVIAERPGVRVLELQR